MARYWTSRRCRRVARRAASRRDRSPGHRRVPVGSAVVLRERRCVPHRGARARARSASRDGSCCSAKRSPISTSARRRCSSNSIASSTPRVSMCAFVEMRTRLQDMTQRYGLFDTLDRDHFYPTMRAAIAAIRSEQTREGPAGWLSRRSCRAGNGARSARSSGSRSGCWPTTSPTRCERATRSTSFPCIPTRRSSFATSWPT